LENVVSDEDKSRKADIRIVRAADSSYYRVDVKFLGTIAAAIKWDERVPGAREDLVALLKESPEFIKSAFLEIDFEKATDGGDLDSEWAYYEAENNSVEQESEDTMHQPVDDEDEA
jgi:hypothetical protein